MASQRRGPPKTVYLVRHGETTGNLRFAALSSCARCKCTGSTAKLACRALMEFFCCKASSAFENPALSERGEAQARDMANQLEVMNFITAKGIQLIAHSDLDRATRTCEVLFPPSAEIRVESHRRFREWYGDCCCRDCCCGWWARLQEIRDWLAEESADKIVIVGHGMLFSALTGTHHFGNVEMRSYEYDVDSKQFAGETFVCRPADNPDNMASCLGTSLVQHPSHAEHGHN